MYKPMALILLLVLITSCSIYPPPESKLSSCEDCAVHGSFEIPYFDSSWVIAKISMYEYDSDIADKSADIFDEVEITVIKGTNIVTFDIGEQSDLKNDREYYLSSGVYQGISRIYFGRCSHGDFCKVLEPEEVKIIAD